jgi:hypothetical protein
VVVVGAAVVVVVGAAVVVVVVGFGQQHCVMMVVEAQVPPVPGLMLPAGGQLHPALQPELLVSVQLPTPPAQV